MAVPKGTKLATGYRDRARDRDLDDRDDREARIKALEEQMKLGQIEPEVFAELRDSITGGDIGATHLVKGLDMRLLERVRRGEDVLSTKDEGKGETEPEHEQGPDLDEEIEQLEGKEIAPVERERVLKKGIMAPPPLPVAGAKRSRNDILAELKASRKAAADAKAAAQPTLSSKFKKVGTKKPSSKVEIDDRGREVLITVDENGNTKRKVRKLVKETPSSGLLMLDKTAQPLGMAVPELAIPSSLVAPEENDDDIFEGVGDEYNPLGDMDEDDSSSNGDDDKAISVQPPSSEIPPPEPTHLSHSPLELPSQPRATSPPGPRRNYFNDTSSNTTAAATSNPAPHLTDPTFLATLTKAAAIASRTATSDASSEAPAAPTIAQRLLANQDRDFEDMDMGFGGSRFDDAEEMDEGGAKVKLSKWKGLVGGEDEDGEDGDGQDVKAGKKGKRGKKGDGDDGEVRKKGGAKKKKGGDKNSAVDVLRVIEGRKGK